MSETGGQLKLLMDYTIFHIGLCSTLITLLIAILGITALQEHSKRYRRYLLATLICFVIAGAFGGIIGSSLPYYATWDKFLDANLGPWFLPDTLRIPSSWAASAEHTAFWVGIVIALFGLIKAR
jgi:hypothetical protein